MEAPAAVLSPRAEVALASEDVLPDAAHHGHSLRTPHGVILGETDLQGCSSRSFSKTPHVLTYDAEQAKSIEKDLFEYRCQD